MHCYHRASIGYKEYSKSQVALVWNWFSWFRSRDWSRVGNSFCIYLSSLSAAAARFRYLHFETDTTSHSCSGISEVVSVWKAALSVSIDKLPTTHPQRLLIALPLAARFDIHHTFSGQMFALIKSKPRLASMKTCKICTTLTYQSSPFPNCLHRIWTHLRTRLCINSRTIWKRTSCMKKCIT